ncbi:MAG: RES family NAD+ phosphorylase [Alphaproteobacteria bacterium]
MILWRACRAPYATLDGEGARRFGGRWNSSGRPAVYLAEHPALAILEIRAHLDLPLALLPDDYVVLRIEAPDGCAISTAPDGVAPGEEAAIGDDWLEAGHTPLLEVPSILAPRSRNYLLNPLHPDARSIRIVERLPFVFDPRLLAEPGDD